MSGRGGGKMRDVQDMDGVGDACSTTSAGEFGPSVAEQEHHRRSYRSI